MNKYQALQSFWGGFGLKAYDETSVPDNSALPYITYESAGDSFDNTLFLSASLWCRSTSWTALIGIEQTISDAIGRGGKLVKYEGGTFWIRRGHPWMHRMDDPEDDSIRRIILNVIIEFID